jgi:hypothetical protein
MSVKLGLSLQKEKHRMRVFGNRVLKRIFDPRGSDKRLDKLA